MPCKTVSVQSGSFLNKVYKILKVRFFLPENHGARCHKSLLELKGTRSRDSTEATSKAKASSGVMSVPDLDRVSLSSKIIYK